MSDCVFCDIATGDAPEPEAFASDGDMMIFEPLNPVVPGHRLVVPVEHVADVGESQRVAKRAMAVASVLASHEDACNVITSRGAAATQTVFHLHIHVVPREPGDGLALPWTGQPAASG